jgi:hypothetical protein
MYSVVDHVASHQITNTIVYVATLPTSGEQPSGR